MVGDNNNLAKLDVGLAESTTVMVVDKTKQKQKKTCKNRGILKPSWAFVETNNKTSFNGFNSNLSFE
jgi:hypothetical protein